MTTATPGPRFQGRLLPHPDDEITDQGLGFDLGTLLDRRRMLRLFGVGVVGVAGAGLAACSTGSTASGTSSATAGSAATSSSSLTEIPEETNGPYPGDGSNGPDVLEQSGVVRSDVTRSFGTSTTVAEGVAMTLTLTVLDLVESGAPMAGAAVYIWQCDRAGNYSMYSAGLEGENYLRGVQITDADGRVTFTSIFPACYSGRWPHVHFEVYPDEASIADATTRIATSQVALPQNVCQIVYATTGYEASVAKLGELSLASDNVFGDDGGVHQVGAVTGSVEQGYTVTLTVPVDTSTTPTTSGGPGGGRPGGGGRGGNPGGAPS